MSALLTLLFILLLSNIPTATSIRMTCYSNGSLILPSNTTLYYNSTLQSCQCLVIQRNMTGFQYNSDEQSCYIFKNNVSLSNIRVKANSRVCFANKTTTVYFPVTTASSTSLPLPPIETAIQLSNSNYFVTETININNTVSLTSLSIVITVLKTVGITNEQTYTNIGNNAINTTINSTNTSIIYSFKLIPGKTIYAGQWHVTVQFSLSGQNRSTTHDTYIINITSYQPVYGHF